MGQFQPCGGCSRTGPGITPSICILEAISCPDLGGPPVQVMGGEVEILARLFGETGALYTCDVVTGESLSGGTAEERRRIGRRLDALEYIAIDPEAARWAGERRRQQRSASRRAPLGDALIAAVAWRMGAAVVTRNPSGFESFGVPVRNYGGRPQANAGTKRGSTS